MLAACGSSNTSSGTQTAAAHADGLKFAACMRSHGVQNFPDPPTGSGGGLQIAQSQSNNSGPVTKVNGVAVSSPAFQSAMEICNKDLPHGHPSAAQTEQAKQQALAFSRCMRAHGVTDFPDPQFVGGPDGNTGVRIKLTGAGLNPQSPAFQKAQGECGGGPKGPLTGR